MALLFLDDIFLTQSMVLLFHALTKKRTKMTNIVCMLLSRRIAAWLAVHEKQRANPLGSALCIVFFLDVENSEVLALAF